MEIDEVVARWNAEEEAVRSRLGPPGIAPAGDVADKSGMEVFRAIFAGELPQPPIGDTLNFVPIRMSPGEAVFQGGPQQRHYNPLGTVHAAGSRRCLIRP